jgi:phage tail sheath protein FI
MPITPTYPGVYIEEIPSGVRTIVGVATSITAFVGRALRGPLNEPRRIQNFGDFERIFGGLWERSMMSFAVQHYFTNGGTDAVIVRVHNPSALVVADDLATIDLPAGGDTLTLEASSPGSWGNNLRATVNHQTRDADLPPAEQDLNLFNLIIDLVEPGTGNIRSSETFPNISRDSNDPRFITAVLQQQSNLVRVRGTIPANRPDESPLDPNGNPVPAMSSGGDDGQDLTAAQFTGTGQDAKEGIYALEKTDIFNLLCLPPLTRLQDMDSPVWTDALTYCKYRRAMLIVDAPSTWASKDDAVAGVTSLFLARDQNAAIYFPRLRMPDPLKENRLEEFAPSGAVAGIFARTDAQRGVWKAPAGLDATVIGVRELTVNLTDGEQGQLNPLGVNCLRTFPVTGTVAWGARTLRGADRLASEWKYVPVRRLALFIEESLYRGTKWVVFEPNDEPLYALIRKNLRAFMMGLFRQGAFQGTTPDQAFYVKCDGETTTANDRNLGIVNIEVGFAPLKPAEFVVIKIQQIAEQAA